MSEKENPKNMEEYSDNKEMRYVERKRWLFLGLPFTFTKYSLKDDVILINTGFLTREENDCYMYKVQDVTLKRTLAERLVGLGTVICYTGDTTHKCLQLEHIKHSVEIKNYISKASEEARLRRRTLNTLDIGTHSIEDMDDME